MLGNVHVRVNLTIWMVLLLGLVFVGCSGSGIRTMVHQSPGSTVYLEWVPTESFQASHPVELSPTVIRRSLKGVMVRIPAGIVENLLGKEAKPAQLFSEEDVKLFVPHLVEALSRATPEEHVVFKRMKAQEPESVKVAGTLHRKIDLLVLTITTLDKKAGPSLTLYKGNRDVPDSSGLEDMQFSFIPKTAWRQDLREEQLAQGPSFTKTLNLDLTVLAELSIDQPDSTVGTPQEAEDQKIQHTSNNLNPGSKASGQTAHENPEEAVGEAPRSKQDAELKELDEKFKSLRRELSDVETEIERLKKKP